jgi:hypothetical protein
MRSSRLQVPADRRETAEHVPLTTEATTKEAPSSKPSTGSSLKRLPFLPVLATTVLAKDPAPATPVIREMSTDRPDITESAFTVPRGMWQFEFETVSVSRDAGRQTEDWGSVNLKYGLTDSVDLQWVTPAWHREDGLDGWTDSELRLKWNLTGQDDDAPLAVALMPYVKLPVASRGLGNDDVEGGLIIPMALTKGPLAWMLQADLVRNDDDDGYTGALTLTATSGFDLSDRLSAYMEGVATLPLEGDAEMYLNGGLVFALNQNWSLDAGVNIGLNRAAEDARCFTGTSFRF